MKINESREQKILIKKRKTKSSRNTYSKMIESQRGERRECEYIYFLIFPIILFILFFYK